MPIHIDPNDPRYRDAAAEILRRHDNFEPEANITSAVRDFLILTGLAESEEMVEENPPSEASRRAVDLTALDTFIEFKRRIGTTAGGDPDPENVRQLDDYLAQSASQGRVRMGVLTDGKRWLLRWPGAGEVRLIRPYAFTFRTGDMFAENEITIQTMDEENTELVFPVSLVERAENFDALMGDVSAYVERGEDPFLALDDNHVNDPIERQIIGNTIAAMQRLHDRGRNHIWAYYTRNMVRPVALSRSRVDVVTGNPPWINYNQTADVLRTALQNLSRERYGIWAGGRYATHQDVAGLFFARSVDLYLKDGGVIGFVLPHSALQAGQYAKWRGGQWHARKSGPSVQVDFTLKPPWDLERLKPNDFFPVPASVVFALKLPQDAAGKPLEGSVERWIGRAGADDVRRESAGITNTGAAGDSPYAGYSRQGATIVPRRLFFVNETENTAVVQAAPTVTVNPRRGKQDKAPWKALDLTAITGQTVENRHLFDVHLGETIVPYIALEPLNALLPLKRGDAAIPADDDGPGGIRLGGLERRMRERWQTVSRLWENNKALANNLNLLGQLDYMHKLSSQLEWQQDEGDRPVRVVYTKSGSRRLRCSKTAGHWLTTFSTGFRAGPSTKPTTCWPSSTATPCKRL